MYIAQVLQDSSAEEAGSGSSEDEGQGSLQDEESHHAENSINEDFQSCEDSLIENEVRQWKPAGTEGESRNWTWCVHWMKCGAELTVLQSFPSSTEGPYTD